MPDTFDPNAVQKDPQNTVPVQPEQPVVQAQPVQDAQPVQQSDPIQQVQPEPQQQPGVQAQPVQQPVQQQVGDTAPLVLGILSIVFAGIIGLILSIVGMSKSKKVLAVMPDSGKAKAGRICSIIGLIISVISFIAVIAMLALGVGIFGGEAAAVDKAANQTLESLTKPSASEKEEIATYFESAFESASGLSLAKLGVNKTDFSNWLFDGTSYKITNTSFDTSNNSGTATVTADVTARSFEDLSTTINTKTNSPSVTEKLNAATTEADVYAVIGQIIKDSMADTPASTKTVTFKLTKQNGSWVVDDSTVQQLAYQIYAS